MAVLRYREAQGLQAGPEARPRWLRSLGRRRQPCVVRSLEMRSCPLECLPSRCCRCARMSRRSRRRARPTRPSWTPSSPSASTGCSSAESPHAVAPSGRTLASSSRRWTRRVRRSCNLHALVVVPTTVTVFGVRVVPRLVFWIVFLFVAWHFDHRTCVLVLLSASGRFCDNPYSQAIPRQAGQPREQPQPCRRAAERAC